MDSFGGPTDSYDDSDGILWGFLRIPIGISMDSYGGSKDSYGDSHGDSYRDAYYGFQWILLGTPMDSHGGSYGFP